MKILGIDPGTNRIGYGLIESNGTLNLLDYGVIELAPSADLLLLAKKIDSLFQKFNPELVAVEKIYFAKNQKTAINVAQARGVIIFKILENKIKFAEYGPTEIKKSLTNYGQADKKAVALMVKKILNVQELQGYDDASDALAIAITAANYKKCEIWG